MFLWFQISFLFFMGFFFFFFFLPYLVTYGLLVPRPGIKPILPALEVRSPNHWATREFLQISSAPQILLCGHLVFLCIHLMEHIKTSGIPRHFFTKGTFSD